MQADGVHGLSCQSIRIALPVPRGLMESKRKPPEFSVAPIRWHGTLPGDNIELRAACAPVTVGRRHRRRPSGLICYGRFGPLPLPDGAASFSLGIDPHANWFLMTPPHQKEWVCAAAGTSTFMSNRPFNSTCGKRSCGQERLTRADRLRGPYQH
jgi:hypothetical protein